MSNNDYEDKVRKGQAINLAFQIACSEGRSGDNKYIVEQFLRIMEFAKLLQKATPEQLATAVDNPKFIKLIKELDSELQANRA